MLNRSGGEGDWNDAAGNGVWRRCAPCAPELSASDRPAGLVLTRGLNLPKGFARFLCAWASSSSRDLGGGRRDGPSGPLGL